jgi:predicted DNA-binding transcriptional regulator AlpA
MRKTKRGEIPSRPFPKHIQAVPNSAPAEVSGPIKLLSKKEVLALLGVSNVTLWDWIRKGHFPASVVIGPDGGHRSKQGWIDTEVYKAIANAPRRMPKGTKVKS